MSIIKYNNKTINKLEYNTSEVNKMYYNSDVCYGGDGGSTPTPPSFDGKWLATYTGGTTSSAQCDSSSAITSGEITLTDLVSVEIGDCVTSIGNSTFNNCTGLTSATIGSGVTSIGDYAFSKCTSLSSVTIPDSVASIGQYVFRGCSSLRNATIGSGITSIGNAAFYQCTSLISITCLATTPPTIKYNTFNSTNNCLIYVPAESVSLYKRANNWSSLSSRIRAIPQ